MNNFRYIKTTVYAPSILVPNLTFDTYGSVYKRSKRAFNMQRVDPEADALD